MSLAEHLTAIRERMPECHGLELIDESEEAYYLRAKLWSERFQEHVIVLFFIEQELVDEPEVYGHIVISMMRDFLQAEEETRGN